MSIYFLHQFLNIEKKWNLTTGTSHRGLACESSQMIPTSPSCLHIWPYMCWHHCDTQMKSPGFLYWVPWTSQKEIPCILQQNISYLENKMFKSHLSYNKQLSSKLFYLINKQFLLTHYIQLKTGNQLACVADVSSPFPSGETKQASKQKRKQTSALACSFIPFACVFCKRLLCRLR